MEYHESDQEWHVAQESGFDSSKNESTPFDKETDMGMEQFLWL